jgi:hypothetical protein
MKASAIICAAATFLFAGTTALASEREEPVAVNVDHLQAKVAAEVKKHADEGERALARYMERTRPYHRSGSTTSRGSAPRPS